MPASASPSDSPSMSISSSPSVSASASPSPTPSASISFSPSVSPSASPSVSPSMSISASPSSTPSASVSTSPSVSFAMLGEQEILNIIYALYEGDTTNWDSTSDEYLSARVYANTAINRWEFYDQTNWKELWTTLTEAATGDKTITAGTSSYICPKDFIRGSSYVRTVDASGGTTFWDVIPLSKVGKYADNNSSRFCYFTGNLRDRYYLHFNPGVDPTIGHTIEYEYYKSASKFFSTTSTTEMSDPYFIVYFVLSRFYENDGEDGRASKAFQEAEARLENMRTQNMVHIEGVTDTIEDNSSGFGY